MSNNDIEVSVDLTKLDVSTNVDIETKQNIITDIVLSSGGGTKDHNKLKNRDMENQHPITAITDLPAKLTELDTTDADLQDKILSETTRATTKEIKLETAINKEISRATTKEDSLEASIDTEITRAISAERILTNSVNNLSATVSNNYTSLSDKINTKQPIGDYATNTALNTEITRATQAEKTLTNNINNLSVTVDSNYSVLSDKINTKQPIGDYATNTAVNTVSQNLAQEITNRKNADIELQQQITANKTNFVNYRTAENQDIIDNTIKASIPTKNSQLTNDSGFITSDDVPTKVSQLINDSDYQTSVQVMTAIASIPQFKLKIVDSLPKTGEKMVLYLVRKEVESLDIFNEYLWIEETSSFELLGSTDIDLSEYYKKTETDSLLNNKVDKVTGKSLISDTEIERLSGVTNYDDTAILNNISGINSSIQGINADLATKQDVISDLSTIREGAILGSTALQTETDPVYMADKPYLALKSELPIIPTNVSDFYNDAGYITNTVNDLVNYTNTTALTDLLSKKQDTLVNQENIKSVNNQSLLGSGNLDIDTLENVTYAELVELKTNGQLKNGLYYRITDYVTTTNGASANSAEPSRSAGHQFDIIVQALGTSDLSEICTACLHEGDTYFINDNLSGWQIWYDINNDTTKYAWADTTNGKGVIYRLIDEKGNECPYDFKNIQFYRNPSNYSDIKSLLTVSDGYYYTFSHYTSSTTVEDWTLGTAGTRFNFENKLGECSDRQSDGDTTKIKKLNNSLFILTQSASRMTRNSWGVTAYNNTMVTTDMFNNSAIFNFTNNICSSEFTLNNMGITVNNNKFLGEFSTNYISGSFNNNTIKAFMSENVFYMYFYNNTVNKQFAANIILYSCQNNTFSGDFMFNVTSPAFSSNKINGNFTYNFTSPSFQNNTISGELKRNSFGVRFRYNNAKSMLGNDIGNNVTYCTFGDGFNYNNVSNNAYYCTFGDYNTNNTVEPSIGYIKTASGTYGVNLGLSNSTIKAGVIGSSSTNLLDLTALPTNTSYPMTIEKDINGKILATWSDSGATKGKYKDSITATEWNDINTTIQIENWEE